MKVPGSPTSLNQAGKYSLPCILWGLAAWILVLYVYITYSPPDQIPVKYVAPNGRLSIYLQSEKDMYLFKSRRGQRSSSRQTRRAGNFIAAVDFVNPSSLNRQFYFPNRSLAIDPMACPTDEKYYIYPGREWLDTDGRPIQAHGGGILYDEQSETFYWYGENRDGKTYRLRKRSTPRVDVIGVSCYSSKDLWTWKNEGIVLTGEAANKSHDLFIGNVLERPKVIFNNRTNQYVMWMHIDNADYSKASIGLATSASPVGPFTYLYSFRPHGFDSRDMTIFKDEDGAAYVVYSSRGNTELHIGVLADDYLGLKKVMIRAMVGMRREAPAVFKHRGIYYMVTSGCTSWAPNAALVHSAESMLGPWVTLGNPCVGGNRHYRQTTFFSQGTYVVSLPGFQDMYLFMSDRWNAYNLSDSRYVWLPLTMDGPVDEPMENIFQFPLWSRVSIRWLKRWKLPDGWNSRTVCNQSGSIKKSTF